MSAAIAKLLENVPVKNVFPIFNFSKASIGDNVPFADGGYDVGEKVYVVEEGRLKHVWGVHEEQLTIDI